MPVKKEPNHLQDTVSVILELGLTPCSDCGQADDQGLILSRYDLYHNVGVLSNNYLTVPTRIFGIQFGRRRRQHVVTIQGLNSNEITVEAHGRSTDKVALRIAEALSECLDLDITLRQLGKEREEMFYSDYD